MPRFTLRTLLIATALTSVIVASVLWFDAYRHFESAREATRDSIQHLNNANQAEAINCAISGISYPNRNEPILAFAGIHKQRDGRIAIFADWVCMNSPVDSIRIELSGSDPVCVAFAQGEFITDDNLRHHFSVFLDEIGCLDPTTIKHVTLMNDNREISNSKPVEEWKVDWLDSAG